jgi:4-hydroxysphinganine ceramide fatty acyl 2-hydroxylase
MPGRTLPTISRAELEAHNSDKDCFVAIGENVYDVTDFLEGHPGGPELITDWAGKDITEILKDEIPHTHSDSAYEILEEYHVAFVSDKLQRDPGATNGSAPKYSRTGMSREEDMEVDTDFNADYKKHKFIDLSKPMLPQIWCGGFSKEFYLDQIHRPRHYKGGASAPLFGNFLEPLSKTPWWVVPTVWLPCIAYGVKLASEGMSNTKLAVCFGFGFSLWSLIEYVLHRFLFHLD